MKLLSKLSVGSVLIYPSKDTSNAAKIARAFVRYRIKQDLAVSTSDKTSAIEYVARAYKHFAEVNGEQIFKKGGCLVPVPRHTPLLKGALWPALRICEELLRIGLGGEIQPLLERTKAVRQSSTSASKERPSVREHFETLQVKAPLHVLDRLILVDDVVTRGATLVASASHLSAILPDAEIVSFAYARIDTDCRLSSSKEMFSPRVEAIEYDERTDHIRRA